MLYVTFFEHKIESFFKKGILNSISDIYNLSKFRNNLIKEKGYGEKSIGNLLESIENSKNSYLDKFIFGLGIRYVGKKTSKILASNFNSIREIIDNFDETLFFEEEVSNGNFTQNIIEEINIDHNNIIHEHNK